MFIGGCGRFFEGKAEEMHRALNETLAALPDDTKVYPGHEYTKGNVKFAKTVAKDNEAIKKLDAYSQANKETQGKFTIGDEKVRPHCATPYRRLAPNTARNTTSSCSTPIPKFKKPSAKRSLSKSCAHYEL